MPLSTPRLSYKFQRLRERIRGAIESGELAHKLPGERELARRFGVNAKTISKALTDLTCEGVLVRHVGRGTFVAGSKDAAEQAVGSGRRFVFLASRALDVAFAETMFDMIRNRLKQHGHEIEQMVVPSDERGELAERCLPISQLRDLAGIVIQSSQPGAALLADLARRHIPLVLCNSISPLVKVNCVTADYARGGFELTEHLALLGHSRIQLVLDPALGRSGGEFQRGYQTALSRYGLEPLLALRSRPSEVNDVLNLRPAPTALVCLGADLAVALKTCLDRITPRTEHRRSMVAMAEPGQLALQQHLITSYDVYPDQVLDWAIQLLFDSSPGTRPREVIVPGTFNDRGSTSSLKVKITHRPADQVII
jgi:DNA-binding LacI/PurR family transcriptional regulator